MYDMWQPSEYKQTFLRSKFFIVLVFIDMSTLAGHFVRPLREREKREDEREGQGRK